MLNIFKYVSKFIKATRYALIINKADDAQCNGNFAKSLEYLEKANGIVSLTAEDLLTRAEVKRRLKKYTDSIEDARLALQKVKEKKKYSKYDRDYLLYYGCRIGALSQKSMENIEEEFVDQEFKQIKLSKLSKSKVSSYILRNFPLK